MEPLTPNTAAFLSYLQNSDDFSTPFNPVSASKDASSNNAYSNTQLSTNNNSNLNNSITSIPPSAIFPVQGSGTVSPDLTPPSQNDSPDVIETKPIIVHSSGSESDGDDEPRSKNKGDSHKRKANVKTQRNHVSALDDGTDSDMTGHEDKRQHHAGRKPRGSEEGLSKKDKAARRKEQNRAAQKAFRERREAKVSNLEEKLAEVEAKSYGVTLENENLRSMLKRLQEENVALKQSAFTFSMPVNPAQNQVQNQYQGQVRNQKPPTPPHSNSDEVLKTISEPDHSPISLPSTASSTSSQNLFSSPPGLSSNDSFPALSRSDTGISPPSAASDNKSEIDALWASFYPNGVPNLSPQSFLPGAQAQQQLSQQAQQPQQLQQQQQMQMQSQPTFGSNFNNNSYAYNSNFNSFSNGANQNQAKFNPGMAYRDAPAVVNSQPATTLGANDFDWSSLGNIDDFLSSLVDNNADTKPEEVAPIDDDTFNAQLAQILSDNTFSPTKYLNMSPSPLPSDGNSVSNSESPASQQPSSATSPESSVGSTSSSGNIPSQLAVKKELNVGLDPSGQVRLDWDCHRDAGSAIVHVLDKQGNIIKPSDLWVHMGMQRQSKVDNLVIDDLCDQMKAKATCKDAITVDNLQHMLRYNGDEKTQKGRTDGFWGNVAAGREATKI